MNIALIAHDQKKDELIELARKYRHVLEECDIVATGHTGKRLQQDVGLKVQRMNSGPYGGDQQIGALVARDTIDYVIFLRDPLTAQPHEPDVSALMRVCDVHNVPLATNEGSAKVFLSYLEQIMLQKEEC